MIFFPFKTFMYIHKCLFSCFQKGIMFWACLVLIFITFLVDLTFSIKMWHLMEKSKKNSSFLNLIEKHYYYYRFSDIILNLTDPLNPILWNGITAGRQKYKQTRPSYYLAQATLFYSTCLFSVIRPSIPIQEIDSLTWLRMMPLKSIDQNWP